MNYIHKEINNDKQIWKFCFYGLLKNLKFFEPYLLIYLLGMGLNLFKIGLLFSVKEIITYIFEIPSGIFADNYGNKKELMICFAFYIISFVFFFLGFNFYILIIAMIFFGLGEAFRSGTHKSIIYSYLEQKNWFEHKAYVYGRTRSFSLLGSSISAFVSILFILNLPSVRWIFILCIIPYILDFLLIGSYPDNLDNTKEKSLNMKEFFTISINQIKNIFSNNKLTKILISSSLYDGIFKTIKDYIQPILKTVILTTAVSNIQNLEGNKTVKLYLGIIYGVFYIFSSFASKNVYRLNKFKKSDKLLSIFFDIMAILLFLLFISVNNKWTLTVIIIFFLLYILKDARRPIFVDICGDHMDKQQRATVLSIDSQLKSLFTILLAPIFGLICDHYSIGISFLILSIAIVFINRFLEIK